MEKFEGEFAQYCDRKYCIGLNSGTDALEFALRCYKVEGKVITVPNTYFTSASSINNAGLTPKFVDVDHKTLCLDPGNIRHAITKKTRVILPVHFAGMPCNLKDIKKICDEFDLMLIEDAAHAAGSLYQDKKIGTHGQAVCFSFHPVKNLAMPTGGAISLNGVHSKNYEKKLRALRWCGITNRRNAKYDVKEVGWNYYMNEFSAAIGLEQLKKLDQMNRIRKKIAKRYSKEIILEQKMPYSEDCSYHLYWIQVKNRTTFMKKMKENYVETGIHYKPIHTMQFYKEKLNLTITENVGKQIVSIPIHPSLAENEIDKIIQLVNKFS